MMNQEPISNKIPPLNLYDLKNEILKHWHVYRCNARQLATHRYTATDICQIVQAYKYRRITNQRVGLTLQAMGIRYYQDRADGQKYFYLSAKAPEQHSDFMNPFYVSANGES